MQREIEKILIYACADIHGVRERLRFIGELVEKEKPHCLVVAGDILSHPGDSLTVAALDELEVETFVVPGNMDSPNLKDQVAHSRNLYWIVGRGERFAMIHFYGVDEKMNLSLKELPKLMGQSPLVLISHRPPWGIQDRDFFGRHAGSKEIAALLKNWKPKLLICGHIHEDPGYSKIDDVHVINCSMGGAGRGYLIEFEDGHLTGAKMVR